jgi:hypothetical protein
MLIITIHRISKSRRQLTAYIEFQRSIDGPQPTYTDYVRGNEYSCEATLEGFPNPFSSKEAYFSNKKAARQDAARHVVEYFKANGQWPDTFSDVGGIKKKKVVQPPQPSGARPSSSASIDAGAGADTSSTGSYAQQVVTLASQLGLNTPSWNYVTEDSASGFHTVTCSFKDGGALEGPLGEVRHIYGKKKAKEECARLTLEYLRIEKEKRMSYGRKMMEGVVGGEGAASVAVGQPIGGSREIEKAVLRRAGEVGESSGLKTDEEEDDFEDAVEDIGTDARAF